METFVIAGKAKTVFKLIELKAKIEMANKQAQALKTSNKTLKK